MHDPTHSPTEFELAQAIRDNHVEFLGLLAEGDRFGERGELARAATAYQIAARFAWENSTGLFASPELERRLFTLAARAGIPPVPPPRERLAEPGHVLHVLTQSYIAGGHSRLAWRWIDRDDARRHSVAITAQGASSVPPQLADAVRRRGGELHTGFAADDMLASARELRRVAALADLIVLHTHPHDVAPIIAFAPGEFEIPVAVLNHASHVFWLGAEIASACICVLEEGRALSVRRRGFSAERCPILPIPQAPPPRIEDKRLARAKLALPENATVLLSSGSPYKYNPVGGTDFRMLVVDALERHPDCILLVAGPTSTPYWDALEAHAPGRVRLLGYVDEAKLNTCFAAADVYLDSAPFGSATALLDAASCGLPILSFASREWREAGLCFDQDGLDCASFSFDDAARFRSHLESLLANPEAERPRTGERAQWIVDQHAGPGWYMRVKSVYEWAMKGVRPAAVGRHDEPRIEPIDLFLEGIAQAARPGANAGFTPDRKACVKGSISSDRERYATADALLCAGRRNEAAAILGQLVDQGTDVWEAYNDFAFLQFEAGLPEQALDLMRAAARLQREGTTAQLNLARLLLVTDRHAEALSTCTEALRRAPDDPEAVGVLHDLLTTLPLSAHASWIDTAKRRLTEAVGLAAGQQAHVASQIERGRFVQDRGNAK